MTVSSIGSYVTTAAAFVAHASDVNAARLADGTEELIWPGGYRLADFVADRNAVEAKLTDLVGLENTRQLVTDDRDRKRVDMRERLRQFRLAVSLHLKGTTYFQRLPKIPQVVISESKFLRPFDDMDELWSQIDDDESLPNFTPPLKLSGGYALNDFETDLAAMRACYRAVTEAENSQDAARKERDAMLLPLRERMSQYRKLIQLEYGRAHAFTQSLPDVFRRRVGARSSPANP